MALKRGNYHVECDFCGGKSAPADSGPAARKAAKRSGWGTTRIERGFRNAVCMDLCPGCVKRRKGGG